MLPHELSTMGLNSDYAKYGMFHWGGTDVNGNFLSLALCDECTCSPRKALASQKATNRHDDFNSTSHRPWLNTQKSRGHIDAEDNADSIYASTPRFETLYSSDCTQPSHELRNNNNDFIYNLNQFTQDCDVLYESGETLGESHLEHWSSNQVTDPLCAKSFDISNADMVTKPHQYHVDSDYIDRYNVTFHKAPKVDSMEQIMDIVANPRKHRETKQILRENHWNLMHPIRSTLWKTLIQARSSEMPDEHFYWELVQSNYGNTDLDRWNSRNHLPNFVSRSHMTTYGLTADGIKMCQRVLGVINYHNPTITYAPSLYYLTALLLHYMSEPDVFHCLTILITSRKPFFVAQSKVKHVASFQTFQQLCKRHLRTVYMEFRNSACGQTNCFMNWLTWIFEALPFMNIVRIMDCFLFEGHKALMRAGMAVFNKWMRHKPLHNPFLTTLGPFSEYSPYNDVIPDNADKMLKAAYSIRGVTEREINKLMVTNEESALKTGVEVLMEPTTPIEDDVLEEAPVYDLQDQSATNELFTMFRMLKSAHLAERRLRMVYTTREDGNTLTSFYRKVEHYNELFLVVKENNNSMFGAFLSAPLVTRNLSDEHGNTPRYFGTGESFLFQLRPHIVVYPWVVAKMQQENRFLSNYEHNVAQFIYAGHEMLCIGGGDGQGLMLDHDFENGKSEHCKTFNNNQLSENEDFKIMAVEAYCVDRTD